MATFSEFRSKASPSLKRQAHAYPLQKHFFLPVEILPLVRAPVVVFCIFRFRPRLPLPFPFCLGSGCTGFLLRCSSISCLQPSPPTFPSLSLPRVPRRGRGSMGTTLGEGPWPPHPDDAVSLLSPPTLLFGFFYCTYNVKYTYTFFILSLSASFTRKRSGEGQTGYAPRWTRAPPAKGPGNMAEWMHRAGTNPPNFSSDLCHLPEFILCRCFLSACKQ